MLDGAIDSTKKTFHLTFGWDQKSFCGLSSSDLGRQRVFWMARCCLWRAYCDWFNMEKSLDNLLELKTVSTADSRIVRWPNSTWQGKITLAYLDKNRQYWCSRMFKGSINKQDQQTHLAVRYLWFSDVFKSCCRFMLGLLQFGWHCCSECCSPCEETSHFRGLCNLLPGGTSNMLFLRCLEI